MNESRHCFCCRKYIEYPMVITGNYGGGTTNTYWCSDCGSIEVVDIVNGNKESICKKSIKMPTRSTVAQYKELQERIRLTYKEYEDKKFNYKE